jgi:hypothetical protein
VQASPDTDYYSRLTYSSNNPFIVASLKIKRANRHLSELTLAADRLPRRHGYPIAVEKSDDGKLKLTYLTENRMPIEFSGVLGDAIHNVRSAFDLIAVALTARPLGDGKAGDAYFPTGKDRQQFIRARDGYWNPCGRWRKGKMQGAQPDALRLIEELEPYDGGKHSLRALHQLDIMDKHKLLIPSISRVNIARINIAVGDKTLALGSLDFKAQPDDGEFAAEIDIPSEYAGEGDIKIDKYFDPTFTIVFGQTKALRGERIVPTLPSTWLPAALRIGSKAGNRTG